MIVMNWILFAVMVLSFVVLMVVVIGELRDWRYRVRRRKWSGMEPHGGKCSVSWRLDDGTREMLLDMFNRKDAP